MKSQGIKAGAVIGMLLCASVMPPHAAAQSTTVPNDSIRWAGAISGAVIGVGMVAVTSYLHFGFEDEWTTAERWATFVPMATASLASSLLTTVAFFDLFVEVPMHPALAGLAGLGAGALEGAIVGGATFGTYFLTTTYFDPTFVAEADSIYEAGWIGLRGGTMFGVVVGAIPGAIAGIVLALLRE
jgi:tetrahydromethanopterin S-methyltransferase subunit G